MPSVYLSKSRIDKRRRPYLKFLYSPLQPDRMELHQVLNKLNIATHQKDHINYCNETFTSSRKKICVPPGLLFPLQNKWTLIRQLYSGLVQSNAASVQSF